MFSDRPTIKGVRDYLVGEIKPLLPRRWKVAATVADPDLLSVPAVQLVFSEINVEQDGAPTSIDGSQVEAVFQLVLIAPRDASEDLVDGAFLDLVLALNASPSVGWGPKATKGRLDSGQLTWTTPVAVMATASPTSVPTP